MHITSQASVDSRMFVPSLFFFFAFPPYPNQQSKPTKTETRTISSIGTPSQAVLPIRQRIFFLVLRDVHIQHSFKIPSSLRGLKTYWPDILPTHLATYLFSKQLYVSGVVFIDGKCFFQIQAYFTYLKVCRLEG